MSTKLDAPAGYRFYWQKENSHPHQSQPDISTNIDCFESMFMIGWRDNSTLWPATPPTSHTTSFAHTIQEEKIPSNGYDAVLHNS